MQFETQSPSQWLSDKSTADDVVRMRQFLLERGTFEFPRLPNGLFPAASGVGDDFEATRYSNVWLRDNVQIAYAHFQVGDTAAAVKCVSTLAKFLSKHRYRFDDIIDGRAGVNDPMRRPHIRFRGEDLTEIDEKWAHAQNDALGYFLWLYAMLIGPEIPSEEANWELITSMFHYFAKIEYWKDEDSGHWEETRKISASSIGVVVAALTCWKRKWEMNLPDCRHRLQYANRPVTLEMILHLELQGELQLQQILPNECRQVEPNKYRRFDSALLFLCYPLNVLGREMTDRVLNDVVNNLSRPHGIIRYHGDSYWCANYKDLLSPESRTVDFSDDLHVRNDLFEPGTEAQWCIFDSTISSAYGLRYEKEWPKHLGKDNETLRKQIHHLKRSLGQLTTADHFFGPYRCPESYFLHHGQWIPNDITPLLWSQGNLMQSLWWMENSFRKLEQSCKS